MSEASHGLMASARQFLSTLLSVVSTRLELLANELQEERLHLTQMLVMGLFALFCFGMGILLLTMFVVVLYWDDHRLMVLGLLSALFMISGASLIVILRSKAQQKSKLFSASLAEFAKDRKQLEISPHQSDLS